MDRIKGIIFDIDGTLADSMGVWAESDKILLERRNIPYSEEISLALKSMHFMSAVEYLIEHCGLTDSSDSIAAEITDIVRDKYFHEVRLMPYVTEFIGRCRENGIRMCAATSNSRELAEGVLKNNGILDSLEFIITSDEAGSGKDNPDIYFMCAKKMGLSPDETAVVEDSPHAAGTAFLNGFYTIGANSGHFGDFEALKDCTDVRISSFRELSEKMFGA